MYMRCSTNIIKRFDLKVYLEILNTKEINLAFVAPPVVVAFAKNPIVKNYKIQNLKAFICGAAPLSKELEDEILQKYGIKCGQAYGMTELSPLSHTDTVDEKRSGAAGRLAANMEQIVVDIETGEHLGRNKRGELRLKGPNVMMGYYKNEQATKETFDENGHMKTGDIVYIDDDGYIFVVDRLKELIKVRGFQVPPAELEALLLTHPDVADACVIGVPCSKAGELPKGFITLKNPSATNKQEIIKSIHAYFGEHLAHYK
ncbi:acetyl-CoA synthetase-like protein, partial [Conidiobolus coronatus NRRL 28638]